MWHYILCLNNIFISFRNIQVPFINTTENKIFNKMDIGYLYWLALLRWKEDFAEKLQYRCHLATDICNTSSCLQRALSERSLYISLSLLLFIFNCWIMVVSRALFCYLFTGRNIFILFLYFRQFYFILIFTNLEEFLIITSYFFYFFSFIVIIHIDILNEM